MRSISRVVDVSINTVAKLLVDAGSCAPRSTTRVATSRPSGSSSMKSGRSCAKQKNVANEKKGDHGLATHGHGQRSTPTASSSSRGSLAGATAIRDGLHGGPASGLRTACSSPADGHRAYLNAVEDAFGGDVDYAMLIEDVRRDAPEGTKGPLQPRRMHRHEEEPDRRQPDGARQHAYAERRTSRSGCRSPLHPAHQCVLKEDREPHAHGRALHGLVQLRADPQDAENDPGDGRRRVETLWSMDDLCEKMDAVAPKLGKRGPYKKGQQCLTRGRVAGGNIETTPEEKARAEFLRHVKRDKKKQPKYLPKSKSVRSVQGGLPGLGKAPLNFKLRHYPRSMPLSRPGMASKAARISVSTVPTHGSRRQRPRSRPAPERP